jgi:hypothetical protein
MKQRTTLGHISREVAFAALITAALVLFAGTAGAAGPGQFTLKTPSVDEKNGEWHIKVRIDMSRPPSMMHTPMRFTFSKEVVDERAIMSKGAEPEHHRQVIDTPPKQIVSMDVDFADASGKIFKSTLFEFDLQRNKGYFEAGEYTCALAGPDGDVGSAQKLILKGDNPPVYRGAMDFAATDKPGKGGKKGVAIQAVSSGLDGGSNAKGGGDDDTPSSAAPMSTDVAPVGNAPSMIPESASNKTPEEEALKDHPKGCGCVAAGLGSSFGGTTLPALAVPAIGLAALGLVRRRRSRHSPCGRQSDGR